MDIMYTKSVEVGGNPKIDFSGGVPDPLSDAWSKTFQECINAKDSGTRARKCRMAAVLRSEYLFFDDAPSPVKP